MKTLSFERFPYSLNMSAGSIKMALETFGKSDLIEKNGKYKIFKSLAQRKIISRVYSSISINIGKYHENR